MAEVDLVLTSVLFIWKLCPKNTTYHKNNMIYIIKREGLYQTWSTPASFPPVTVKWTIIDLVTVFDAILTSRQTHEKLQ